MNQESYFRVEELSESFGGLKAVNNVSFEVKKGRLTSVIGPNGAGKTTMFDLISGFTASDRGQVVFKGQNIVGCKPHEVVKLGMARTFQHLGLFNKMSFGTMCLWLCRESGGNSYGALFSGGISRRKRKFIIKRPRTFLSF